MEHGDITIKSTLLTCKQDHPYRPTHWRWERSRLLLAHGKATPGRKQDDEWIRKASQLRRALGKAKDDLTVYTVLEKAGDMGLAYQLLDEEVPTPGTAPKSGSALRVDNPGRHELEARILTGIPFSETPRAMHVTEVAIEAYEALFFNVSDRLASAAYIAHQAIGPGLRGGKGSQEACWKIVGWSTQSQPVLDEIITGCRRRPPAATTGQDDLYAVIAEDASWLTLLKGMLAARQIPINEKTSGRLLVLQRDLLQARREEQASGHDADFTANLAAALEVI
jgi:hypothetical protein